MNNEKENKNIAYALICLISGLYISIISSVYTFQMYYDMGYNGVDKILTGFIGVSFDLGKIAFAALVGNAIKNRKWGQIILFGGMLAFCIVNSFIASQGRDLNVTATYQAEAINNSSEKLNNDEAKKAKKQEIETQTTMINSLIAEKDKLPENYITARKNKQIEIDTANKDLKKLNAELEKITNKKIDSKSGFITKGMYNLAKWINPENPDSAIGKIATAKNIAQEIIPIAFLMGFGLLITYDFRKKHKKNDIEQIEIEELEENGETLINKEIEQGKLSGVNAKKVTLEKRLPKVKLDIGKSEQLKKQDITDKQESKPLKPIGFTQPKKINESTLKSIKGFIQIDGVSEKDIILYTKTGFENSKKDNGKIIFPGYQKIAEIAGINPKIARTINTCFSEKGITEVVQTTLGRRTIVKYTKNELLGE